MSNELTLSPLSLIQEVDVKAVSETLSKVKSLQATLKNILVEGHDFGKIQGCGDKPTLLKAGAEKILMALGITSSYELIEHTENFEGKGFFAYTVKCTLLKNGQKITEGLGHANSKEKKWAVESVYEKDLPAGTDTSLLKKREFNGKNGTYYKYEVRPVKGSLVDECVVDIRIESADKKDNGQVFYWPKSAKVKWGMNSDPISVNKMIQALTEAREFAQAVSKILSIRIAD